MDLNISKKDNIVKLNKIVKGIMFIIILLISCIITNQRVYADSDITVAVSDRYEPEWAIDSDYWNFTNNKDFSIENIIDAAYSPKLKQWVCMLSAGDIIISKDLHTWKRYNMGNRYEMRSIIWADDKYIAVGEMFLYSYDGIKWYDANVKISYPSCTEIGRGLEYYMITDIYWNGNQYIAYGNIVIFPLIYISDDGINWRLPDKENEKYTIGWNFCWNGFSWLAVGNDDAILCEYTEKWKEINAVNLTLPGSSQELTLKKCVWTGNEFCAIDKNGAFCTSNDGVKWNVETGEIYNNDNEFSDLLWTGKTLLVYGKNSRGSIGYVRVIDGDWKKINLPFTPQCIRQAGNKLYAFSSNPYSSTSFVASSSDGIKWTCLETNISFAGIDEIDYANGYFYIQTKNNGRVYASKDGIDLIETKNINYITSIISYKKRWIAIASDGLHQSNDGINFKSVGSIKNKYSLNAAASFSGGVCIVGDYGGIYISKNGTDFTKIKSPTKSNLTCLYTEKKLLIAGGENGTIIVSRDKGVTWSNANNNLQGMKITNITKGNGIYIASLDGKNYENYNEIMNTALMSTDGVKWKTIGIPTYCHKVNFFKGYFITYEQVNYLGGSISKYWCSIDGEHWVNHYLTDSKQIINEAVAGDILLMFRTSDGELLMTDGSGQNVQSNMTLKGNITLPEGVVANEDGIEITLSAYASNNGARTCGISMVNISQGDNSIEYELPMKLSDVEKNINIQNISFSIEIIVKDTLGLLKNYYIPLKRESVILNPNYNLSLSPTTFTFKNKEVEAAIHDLFDIPLSTPILSEDLLSTPIIVYKVLIRIW